MIVTFCGHAQISQSEKIEKWLYAVTQKLIEQGATTFYLGGYGAFDLLAASVLRAQKKRYPQIELILVLAYLNTGRNTSGYDSTVYPPLETTPRRFAISHRNRWMVEASDVVSSKIKAAEKRMAEIAVLRTHIINYAKTRDTYVAYRKAGYSKKFREEHEEELLLHQAAKKAFDDMGVKKLPKVKELQAEYARLLEKKKKTYAEYRRSREEMRELLAAKANVDRLLNMEAEHDAEKEKDRDQR